MGSHDLRLGDCIGGMAGLPDLGVDHVVTDAPYSEHVHTRSRRGCIEHEPGTGRAAFNRTKDLGFEHLDTATMDAAAEQFARLARRWVLVFSDTESAHLWREALETHGLEYVRTLFWDKEGGTPQFTGDRPAVACEAITLAHRPGRKRWNGGGKRGIYTVPIALDRGGNSPRVHPTQKPDGLMLDLVRDFTDPGELVCDPFAGSGTTGVACKRLGRSFLGWERGWASLTDDEKDLPPEQQASILEQRKLHNYAAAVKRIEAAREQFQLPRQPKAKQLGLPEGT